MSESSPSINLDLKKFGIAETLLIALFTASTYIVAYNYEFGFCGHFGIPSDFIRMSPEILIRSFIYVSIFIYIAFIWTNQVIYIILGAIKPENNFKNFVLKLHAGFGCLGILIILTFGFSLSGFGKFLILIVGFDGIVVLLSAVIIGWNEFAKKFAPNLPTMNVENMRPLHGFDVLGKYVKPSYVIVGIAIVILTILSNMAGIQAARNQQSFLEISSKQLLIIRIYGDHVLCKSFNAGTKKIGKDIILLNLDQILQIPISKRTFTAPPEVNEG